MNPRETLTMSQKEAPRAGLLKALVAGRVTGVEVGAALHLSDRQVRRLRRRFETEGAEGLVHRSRGRPSRRRLARRLRQRVAALLTTTYRDFNDCHATEKLQEVEGLALSRATVHRWRRALGRPAKHRRRPRQYRARREPRARMGALVQLDASPFAWLEARGPVLHLHGAIDDATGTVLALHFRPTEDLHGYTTLLRALATDYGLPLAFYGDRLNVFLRNDAHWTLAEELQGAQTPTHFGPMLLGCRYPRRVAADNTVRLGLRGLQLPPGPRRRSWAGLRVELRELLDGRLVVLHDTHVLAIQPSPGPAFILRPRRGQRTGTRRRHAPQPRAATGGRYGGSGRHSTFSRSTHPTPAASRPIVRPTRAHPWRKGFSRHSHELYRTGPG